MNRAGDMPADLQGNPKNFVLILRFVVHLFSLLCR
jgi:hypothetical protein